MDTPARIAIVTPGNREARAAATPENNRFAPLFAAFAAQGLHAEPAVYHDDFADEVRAQLLRVDAALVWVNPLNDWGDRSRLDALLREVSNAGVFVSAHPEVIGKLGTKEVLHTTRGIGWGCETYRYGSMDELANDLPLRLATGRARVLKQVRGNDGIGVWKVELPGGGAATADTPIRVRHAKRGSPQETILLREFLERCAPYFERSGFVIDQAWQERLPEGMTRCYLVHDRVGGFGHQAIVALHPGSPDDPAAEPPAPGPRLYHPQTKPEFQALKKVLEDEWVPAAQQLLGIARERLPILWDCDFLLGPKAADGSDTWVLGEINVSSVAPYPESAIPMIVEATRARALAARQARGKGL